MAQQHEFWATDEDLALLQEELRKKFASWSVFRFNGIIETEFSRRESIIPLPNTYVTLVILDKDWDPEFDESGFDLQKRVCNWPNEYLRLLFPTLGRVWVPTDSGIEIMQSFRVIVGYQTGAYYKPVAPLQLPRLLGNLMRRFGDKRFIVYDRHSLQETARIDKGVQVHVWPGAKAWVLAAPNRYLSGNRLLRPAVP